jgi:hypothetical protein
VHVNAVSPWSGRNEWIKGAASDADVAEVDDKSTQAGGSPAAVRHSTWARRRPSLLATGGIWTVALVLLVLTLPQLVVSFGGNDAEGHFALVAHYTSWVVQPISAGYAVTVALAVPLFVALCFRRWSARTRVVVVASLTVVAVTCALVGYDQSRARSHIGPELERAIASLHLPPGLSPLGPTRLLSGDGNPLPEAYRRFQPATATGPADCAALGLIANRRRGWTITGCMPATDTQTGNEIPAGGNGGSMVRADGRVVITITFYPTNDVSAYVITIQASPNDGYGYA